MLSHFSRWPLPWTCNQSWTREIINSQYHTNPLGWRWKASSPTGSWHGSVEASTVPVTCIMEETRHHWEGKSQVLRACSFWTMSTSLQCGTAKSQVKVKQLRASFSDKCISLFPEVPQEGLEREQGSPREQSYCWLVFLRSLDCGISLCSSPYPLPHLAYFRCSPIYHPALPTPGKAMLGSLVVPPPAPGFLLLPVSQNSKEWSISEISIPLSAVVGINWGAHPY